MTHIIYVIGHRSSDAFRVRNLLLVVQQLLAVIYKLNYSIDVLNSFSTKKLLYTTNNLNLKILVLEQDKQATIQHILPKSVEYLFIYNPGEYNRCWAFNVGYQQYPTADYYFFADNDIILKTDDFIKLFNECIKYDAVNPYKYLYDSNPCINSIKKLDLDCWNPKFLGNFRQGTCLAGGLLGISGKLFKKTGGWDERFRGRGYEDYAYTAKIILLTDNIYTFPSKGLHLWHPYDICNTRTLNEQLQEEYKKYTADEFFSDKTGKLTEIGCCKKYLTYDDDINCKHCLREKIIIIPSEPEIYRHRFSKCKNSYLYILHNYCNVDPDCNITSGDPPSSSCQLSINDPNFHLNSSDSDSTYTSKSIISRKSRRSFSRSKDLSCDPCESVCSRKLENQKRSL